jgi:hypothetical protein
MRQKSNVNQVPYSLPTNIRCHCIKLGHAVAHLVEALRYKPEGRGFYSRLVSLEFFIEMNLPIAL